MRDYKDLYPYEYYEGGTIAYDSYIQAQGLLRRMVKWVNECFQPDSVLDVGASFGHVVDAFKKARVPALGVEYSPAAVAWARERGRNVVEGDIRALQQADKSWDLVFTMETLEHVPMEDVPRALRELGRVGRRVVLTTGMTDALHHRDAATDDDPTHFSVQPRQWFAAEKSRKEPRQIRLM